MRRRWIVAGVVITAITAVLAAVALAPGGGEPLTAESLRAAKERWERAGVQAYEMELEESGAQTGRYVVRVEKGSVVSVSRDGHLENPGDKELWSVDGWFRTLQRELENAAQPERVYGVPKGTQVLLRMRSDPKLGYPAVFSRYVMGTNKSVTVRIRRLTRIARHE